MGFLISWYGEYALIVVDVTRIKVLVRSGRFTCNTFGGRICKIVNLNLKLKF